MLRKLWAENVSASLISEQIGGGLSRNAVIGKARRLRLAKRKIGSAPEKSKRKKPSPSAAKPHRHHPFREIATIEPLAIETTETSPDDYDRSIPLSQRKSLLELDEDTCRWPIGEPSSPDFFFCGAAPTDNSSYCAHH